MKMIVPRDYVWSVDVAMTKLAFGFAALGWESVEVECLYTGDEHRDGRRLGLIDRQVRIYADQVRCVFPPVTVFVEQPSGKFIKPPLYYAVGVVQAALFETLDVEVITITSGEWKKATVGVGNATKAQVGAWVRKHDPDIFDQDQADAYAIAWAARRRVQIGDEQPQQVAA